MRKLIFILLVFSYFGLYAQISAKTVYTLPKALAECSGLLYYNDKLITFNDSGNGVQLFVMDVDSNKILREVKITNASNTNWSDWEDIAQDDNYIYVGDIGGFYGWRKSMNIYRVAKADFDKNDEVTADIISFTYADKKERTYDEAGSNWDAEALFFYKGQLVLCTKEWKTQKTTAYSVPIVPREEPYSIKKISGPLNVGGLITGAVYNEGKNKLYMTGYSKTLQPFLYTCADFTADDIFGGTNKKEDINGVGFAAQIEGITFKSPDTFYLSSESIKKSIKGFSFSIDGKLYSFKSE